MQDTPPPIKAYVFDAYGTLFDVHSAVARHADQIGSKATSLSQLWRAKQLEYTWVRSLMQEYRDFEQVTADSLDFALSAYSLDNPSLRQDLLAAYEKLSLYPEVRMTLNRLRDHKCKTAILSNGTLKMLRAAVEHSAIEDLIDTIISVDELKIYKPASQIYRLCTDYFEVMPHDISFQSSNRWDIAGAKRFGFHCVWVNRTNQPDEYSNLSADITFEDLRLLADF